MRHHEMITSNGLYKEVLLGPPIMNLKLNTFEKESKSHISLFW